MFRTSNSITDGIVLSDGFLKIKFKKKKKAKILHHIYRQPLMSTWEKKNCLGTLDDGFITLPAQRVFCQEFHLV